MYDTVIGIDNEVAKRINKLDLKPFSFQEKSSWQFCSYTISFYVLKNSVRMTAHWSNAPLSVFRKQLYVDPGSNGCFATRFSDVLHMFHLQVLLTAGSWEKKMGHLHLPSCLFSWSSKDQTNKTLCLCQFVWNWWRAKKPFAERRRTEEIKLTDSLVPQELC